MKTGHGVGVVVALAIAVVLTGCDEATTSPTAPTASGVLDGLSAPVAASAADARSAPDVRSLKGGGGKPTKLPKDDDGGKGLPPTAMLAGAMDSAGNGFLLTFFNEKDTKLEANTGSKENVVVTTNFTSKLCRGTPRTSSSGASSATSRIFSPWV